MQSEKISVKHNIVIPRLSIGRSGGERVLARLSDELIHLGYSVEFIVYDSSSHYYRTKAKTTNLNKKLSKSYLGQLMAVMFIGGYIRKNFRNSIILFNHHLTCFIYPFIMFCKTLKSVYYIQARESKFQNRLIKKAVCELTYKMSVPKVVNSNYLFDNELRNQVGIIPPGIDCSSYRGKRKSNSALNIGVLGRKEAYKGTLVSLRAIDMIAQEVKVPIVINIGLELPECKFLKANNLLIKHIEIDSESDLQSFYRKNDVVLASGLVEDGAFHYPCAEAMASKVCVISNWAPLAQTLSTLKVSHTDEVILKEKIGLFMSLSGEQIEKEISENYDYVKHNYDWSVVGKKFSSLIDSIVM
ncbi:glycosyltransferase family 4 protein [Vibrio lentus]